MTKNKKKGILWIITPPICLFVLFSIFGIINIFQATTGGTVSNIIAIIFPILITLFVLLFFIGLAVGIYYLCKSEENKLHDLTNGWTPHNGYAGFWKRVAAWIIDLIICVIGAGLIALLFRDEIAGLIILVAFCLYHILAESSKRQATIGKIILGIKVVDIHGNRISAGRATGRFFAKFISRIVFGIGFLMAGFTDKKQALHDSIADTLVVNK